MAWSLEFIKTYMIVNRIEPEIANGAAKMAESDKDMEILLNSWMDSGDPHFQAYIYDRIVERLFDDDEWFFGIN